MPVYRNADTADIFPRRSRRLSRQEPKHYDEEGFEYFDPTLLESRHSSPDPSSESTESRAISSRSHSRSPTPYCPSPSSRSLSPSPFPSPALHAARRLSTTFQNGSRRHSGTHIDPASISPSTSTSTSSHTYSRSQRIPRPPNAFMLFRSHFWSTQKDRIAERDHRQISRMVGVLWNELPHEQKEVFRLKALEVKKEHMTKYPNYRYAPTRDGGFRKQAERKNSSASVGKGVKPRKVEVQQRVKKEVVARSSATVMSMKRSTLSRDYTEVEVKKETEWGTPSPKVEEEEVKMEQDINADAEEKAEAEIDMYVDDDDVKYEEAAASYLSLPTHDVAYSPGYHYKSQLDSDAEDEPEFVPTEDIPPLHLSAPAPSSAAATLPVIVKAEEKQPETAKTTSISPIPHSYLHIDPQFGIRPDRHRVDGSLSPRRGSASSSASSSFSLSSMSSFSVTTTTGSSSSFKSHQKSAATVKAKVENESSLLFSGSAASVRATDFSSSSCPSNPFSQSANPDTWMSTVPITQPDTDDGQLHYFYSSEGLDVSSEQSASGPPPECFLDELLESFQMGVGLDPSVSMTLDTMFDELVEMPLPEEPKQW